MAAAYDDLRRGGPERAERVRRIVEGFLVPWFAPRTATVADVTYFMAHEWLLHLVGAADPATRHAPFPVPTAGEQGRAELSLAEAAEAAGVSLPTARRRWRAGQLPGAYRDAAGQVRVPAAALGAIGHVQQRPGRPLPGLRRRRPVGAAPGARPSPGPTASSRPASTPPRASTPPSPTRPPPAPAPIPPSPDRSRCPSAPGSPRTSIRSTSSAFWLQRIMGLRISEAFGVLVSDVVDLGDTGLLAVQGQGGRTFSVRDDHGQVVAVPYKATLKTAAGSRVLVVPPALTALIRVAIEAFHADPDTGEVDTTARLVPGIHEPGPLRPARLSPRLRGGDRRRAPRQSRPRLRCHHASAAQELRHRPRLGCRHRRRHPPPLHGPPGR